MTVRGHSSDIKAELPTGWMEGKIIPSIHPDKEKWVIIFACYMVFLSSTFTTCLQWSITQQVPPNRDQKGPQKKQNITGRCHRESVQDCSCSSSLACRLETGWFKYLRWEEQHNPATEAWNTCTHAVIWVRMCIWNMHRSPQCACPFPLCLHCVFFNQMCAICVWAHTELNIVTWYQGGGGWGGVVPACVSVCECVYKRWLVITKGFFISLSLGTPQQRHKLPQAD